AVLATHRIRWQKGFEFSHAGADRSEEVPVGANEVFLTTSWWSTCAVRPITKPGRIFYLLQEDERMFYPWGDDRLRCAETLAQEEIRFVINSRLLFEHLTKGPEPLPTIDRRGVWFDPAFPAFAGLPLIADSEDGKRNFFFYARPNNLRNLYWRGLEAISAALEDNVLDPSRWKFYFAGRDLGSVELP